MAREIDRFAWFTSSALHEHPPFLSPAHWRSGQGCPSLRALSDHRSSTFSLEGGLDGLLLRVSNEGLLRPRVARAQETSSLPSFLYLTRNGFEFSPEAVVMVRRTRPFFPPLGTIVVMLSLVC